MLTKWMPFSHRPGTKSVVPWSDWVVEVFPALLRVGGVEFPLHLTGPVLGFTVQLDLERGCIWVWGRAREGHYRVRLQAEHTGLLLWVDRAPAAGLIVGTAHLHAKERLHLCPGGRIEAPRPCERLSLGSAQAQDIDKIREQQNEKLLAPLLFLLGQMVPAPPLVSALPLALFSTAALSGLLVPHARDPLHHGIACPPLEGDPLGLLSGAHRAIRAQLVHETTSAIDCLPHLPSSWDAGRASLSLNAGLLELEWRQGRVRLARLIAAQAGEWVFSFPFSIRSFRHNGRRLPHDAPLRAAPGETLLLDRFEK